MEGHRSSERRSQVWTSNGRGEGIRASETPGKAQISWREEQELGEQQVPVGAELASHVWCGLASLAHSPSPLSYQLTAKVVRSGVVVRMAEEQEFTQLCKLPVQPSHPHCVNNTYRSAQHSQALLRGLLALRDSGILFDVVLVVEGRHIEAHRILLAASCDYFR